METSKLKKFAQYARRSLIEQITTKLKFVIAEDSAARREQPKVVTELEKLIRQHGKEQLVERVAYTWFNRFCALRFMDVNRYTPIAVISPSTGQFQPEILAEAKMGHVDKDIVPADIRQKVRTLLEGSAASRDPQSEAYRLLVVAVCNYWHASMPFMFERISDYTELLMPDDLLTGNSILAYTREAMTPDVCEDVDVIGWLYQFYISEKKDDVFVGLKKNKKITPENIPAATQLFTPDYIVRYLAENSLGRLWMLNHPDSQLVEQMDSYIQPEQPETDFLRISSPEEIKICDPACGSGHMLTYCFDLLYAMYEEEGYENSKIPSLIFEKNLYGIEIDERAGELAAFALTMKARSKQRRFFRKKLQPNICVLENVEFAEGELKEYMDFVGRDLFTVSLQTTLRQFEEADNFGSLIRPEVTDVVGMLKVLEEKDFSGELFLASTHEKVLRVLLQADYLSSKYHVVIANPPYMGGKGMNGRLGVWAKECYPNSKSDLFAMFIERNLDLVRKQGVVAMITMQSWMFLSSFEKLRSRLLTQDTILSMAHLGARAFDSIGGEVVSTTAFVLENQNSSEYKGGYLRLIDGNSETEKKAAIREAVKNPDCGWFYRASATDFKKIPGSPIAYWVSEKLTTIFSKAKVLSDVFDVKAGMSTTDNDLFLRFWHEVGSLFFKLDTKTASDCEKALQKWYPLNKGGGFRKWYGNFEYVVNWHKNGKEIREYIAARPEKQVGGRLVNTEYFFKECFTWGDVAGGFPSFRYLPEGTVIGNRGPIIFSSKIDFKLLAYLNSPLTKEILGLLNPTLTYNVGNIASIPNPEGLINGLASTNSKRLVEISISDWDSYETSWDFTSLPLLNPNYHQSTLKATYQKLRAHRREVSMEMQRLEKENNRIFIDVYGLQDELTPDVPLNEITLTCNPHYRYDGKKSEAELDALLLADTMKELISYAIGCMFGRYALEKPGLILANQGETIDDYLKQIPEPSFQADDDNVIPMLDGDWFTDDITERFYKFLRVTFGEETFEENLKFIEQSIGKDIRKYFLKDFYNDHVKRYKKRPIYWLFSSPKGSFNALIYMHRYRPDTVSVVLNDYLREFRTKLSSQKNHLEAVSISAGASQGEKTKALKEIDKIGKMIAEMEAYERDVLYPLATQQIDIDLDDGVKVNYPKFGAALKKIPGLVAKEA